MARVVRKGHVEGGKPIPSKDPHMEISPLVQNPVPAFHVPSVVRSRIKHIALIGNHLPRRCGIATYTADVAQALARRYPDIQVDIWAMNDVGKRYAYPCHIAGTIEQNEPASYLDAARAITASGADMVWIQHEFGIFGGKAGDHILSLIDRMTVPVAVALHTVLAEPDRHQRRVTLALIDRCETIIVMAKAAREILIDAYGADPDQVVVIPHGIPDRPFVPTTRMKAKLDLDDCDLIMTFGLLSPGKGIETMIAAMPDIVARNPKALYLVLGASHPHCIARNGEAYRDALVTLAQDLGVAEHVRFVDAFFDNDDMLDYLAAADVYVTPYLNPAQVTSGTLAYAVGLGKPIVSTPYVHAQELLADGGGRLVDFGDSAGFSKAVNDLLANAEATLVLRQRTYALGRTMIWPRLAEASLARFEHVATREKAKPLPIRPPAIPELLGTAALERMSDSTGMLQHSILGVPHRAHGYCIDDNARALMLACHNGQRLAVYAAFIDHAWNSETRRFRNFMAFDRHWLEDSGSDDSCGRTVWALGTASVTASDPDISDWARGLYEVVVDPLSELRSPRAQAFMMLGSAAIAEGDPSDTRAATLLSRWGDRLMGLWGEYRKPGWDWFEPVLAYDNARLPEALIRAGLTIGRKDFVRCGIKALSWLTRLQTSPDGHFRAVGSDSFGRLYAPPLPFDQQPVEAWAAIDACDAAYAATGNSEWQSHARTAYRWFLGQNELGLALGDVETGECYDGLIPTGVNRNRGAESILAFHLATVTIQRHRAGEC
jgi:glycosyltransferase involved in cell wall biosynthesis